MMRRLLLPLVLLLLVVGTYSAYLAGSEQIWVSYASLIGLPDAVPNGSFVNLSLLIGGPKWGVIHLSSVEIGDYYGMELVSVSFHRGAPDDIPFLGEVPSGIEKQGIVGARITPNNDGLSDHVILTFRATSDRAKGPVGGKLVYKWFGIPFAKTWAVGY